MTPDSCIFCKIIRGEIPAARIFENERFICIRDIQPQAKVHFLVVPKEHVPSLEHAYPEDSASGTRSELIGALFQTAVEVARKKGLVPQGFRTVFNTGRDGGQTVFHLHLHVLGGEQLRGTFS